MKRIGGVVFIKKRSTQTISRRPWAVGKVSAGIRS
jgi:hypothetical protein